MGCLCRYGILCLFALALMVAPVSADPPAAKKPAPAKSAEKAAKKADKAAKKAAEAPKKAVEPAKKPEEPAKPAAPATQKVKKGLLKITLELEGVFESDAAQEVAVRTEEWAALTVLHAAPHGAVVRKGDVILELDPEKLDRAITDLRNDLKITTLSLQQNEEQLTALEKTTPMDLEAGERAARVAEQDRKYYFDVERPFTLKSSEFSLKMSKEMLEYEQEELNQLEKMYKADDITEETERIVLKRGRDGVDRAKFSLESAQIGHDHAMKFAIPRRDVEVKEATQRKLLEWEKNKVDIPLELSKQRVEIEKLRVQRSQAEERMKHLLADREMLTVKAPIDGIVYYGKIVRGRPGDSGALVDALRPKGGIQPNQVVMTVVQPRPVFIRATVPEGDLHDLRPNLKGTATPACYPDLRLPVTLETTGDIPISPGSFEAKLSVDLKEKAKLLMPGMTCKVKLTPYLKQDALTVPPTAVVTDELDEEKQTVEVLEKDGTTKSRPVTIGRKTDKQVEIVKGLSEGEQVVIEPKKG
jgi:multidrug efflux pump subunit AcrA (membrane-fusion protein)